ncbi:class I SAM-dependent methyltransferase [Streptomyces sp. NPDC002784]
MTSAHNGNHAAYFAFRDELLGPLRAVVLTGQQLCEAGRLLYGRPEGLSLYGIPAPEMELQGIQLLGRTAIEAVTDSHAAAVASATAEVCPPGGNAMVVDLFCGSGNFALHLGRRLGRPVYASEIDPGVYRTTRNNLHKIGDSTLELNPLDYRALLAKLPSRSDHDIYAVEPPWGPAFTAAGLDLARTGPPVREIIEDIHRSRNGRPCLIAIKTNDQIAHDSLTRCFTDAQHLRSLTPSPTLPPGANMNYHIYRLCPVHDA